jgi:hypothetical protein
MLKIKTKKIFKKYNVEEENLSQLGLIWQTHYSQYEIGIKKKEFQKNDLVKKTKFQWKNIKKT